MCLPRQRIASNQGPRTISLPITYYVIQGPCSWRRQGLLASMRTQGDKSPVLAFVILGCPAWQGYWVGRTVCVTACAMRGWHAKERARRREERSLIFVASLSCDIT